MGFMANRLNVSITGLQASAGVYYVPKWTEFASTLMVLTSVVLAFRYAVIYLDILPKGQVSGVRSWVLGLRFRCSVVGIRLRVRLQRWGRLFCEG